MGHRRVMATKEQLLAQNMKDIAIDQARRNKEHEETMRRIEKELRENPPMHLMFKVSIPIPPYIP